MANTVGKHPPSSRTARELCSIPAPALFSQSGAANPLVYAIVSGPDRSTLYVSEMRDDAGVLYGYHVKPNSSGWDAVTAQDMSSEEWRVEFFEEPVPLREIIWNRHKIKLRAPCFI